MVELCHLTGTGVTDGRQRIREKDNSISDWRSVSVHEPSERNGKERESGRGGGAGEEGGGRGGGDHGKGGAGVVGKGKWVQLG